VSLLHRFCSTLSQTEALSLSLSELQDNVTSKRKDRHLIEQSMIVHWITLATNVFLSLSRLNHFGAATVRFFKTMIEDLGPYFSS
jgi:hypothetical protein